MVAAVDAWVDAAQIWTRQSSPEKWSSLQNGIGYQLVLIGEGEGNNPARFEAAIPILRDALAVQTALKTSDAALTADSLCRALRNLGTVRSDRSMMLEAKGFCINALDTLVKLGATNVAQETRDNLKIIEEALAALP